MLTTDHFTGAQRTFPNGKGPDQWGGKQTEGLTPRVVLPAIHRDKAPLPAPHGILHSNLALHVQLFSAPLKRAATGEVEVGPQRLDEPGHGGPLQHTVR